MLAQLGSKAHGITRSSTSLVLPGMYFWNQSVSTARGSRTSRCLCWPRTSRWENAAAEEPGPSSQLLSLQHVFRRSPPRSGSQCAGSGLPTRRAFRQQKAAAGNQSVGQFCRGIQYAGREEPAAPTKAGWLGHPRGATQRRPYSPLSSDVWKAVG